MRFMLAVAAICCATPVSAQQATPLGAEAGRVMVVVDFEVKPENRDKFIQVMKEHAQRSRADDGCQQFAVMLPNNDSKHVLVVETWRDDAALSAHMKEPSFARTADATKELIVARKVTRGITD